MSILRFVLVVGLAVLGAGLAEAGSAPPAKRSVTGTALKTFGDFARSWMADMEKHEATNKRAPEIKYYGGRSYATYKGYAPEFEVEVHATGSPDSPYVGVLKYQEQTFTCNDETTRRCSVAGTVPVTEFFGFRKGRWAY